MLRFSIALLLAVCCQPLPAQNTAAQNKFAGTWQAKFKDRVICTIRIHAGEQLSGETEACSINIGADGELLEPDSTESPDDVNPMLNPVIEGDTLKFEENDDGERLKFEIRLAGEGQATLHVLDAPIQVKPIPLTKS